MKTKEPKTENEARKLKVWTLGSFLRDLNKSLPSVGERYMLLNPNFAEVELPTTRVSWDFYSGFQTRVLRDRMRISQYRRTIQSACHQMEVAAYAWVKSSQLLKVVLNKEVYHWKLPKTHRWEIDRLGLKVVCGKDDYHPLTRELIETNVVEKLTNKIIELKELRRKTELEEKLFNEGCKGVYVRIEDSLAAGNCQQGTESFKLLAGIKKSYILATELIQLGKQFPSSFSRIRLAVIKAIQRHQRELQQGFGELKAS